MKRARLIFVSLFIVALAIHAIGQSGIDWRHYPDEEGSIMTGDSFEMLDNEEISVVHLLIQLRGEDVENIRIAAERCIYNPDKRTAHSDYDVEMEQDQVFIIGKGFDWWHETGRMHIKNDVRVKLMNVGSLTESKEEKVAVVDSTNIVTVTSTELSYEPAGHRAVFMKNVHVVDQSTTVDADKVTVQFDENGDVLDITAVGSVVIHFEDAVATCGAAYFDGTEDRVLLTDDAVVTRTDEVLTGQKIAMIQGRSRIVAESARLILRNRGSLPGE